MSITYYLRYIFLKPLNRLIIRGGLRVPRPFHLLALQKYRDEEPLGGSVS